ncbi:protein kinase [Streptomonospora sp. PA3]|uniref:serine/threonine-protein kinase n=1 Tax=Streptomonospora sp. PA3 TaxID=2607326 RepID=UPI0031BA3A6C
MTDNGHERARPLRTGDPRELGDYRIEGRLGRGGMGTVYLARDPADRLVAVKLIHPDLSDDPDFRRRFAREVASARKVARFSTAGVLDARLEGDPLFIVSEYVPGPNLAQAISAEGPMSGGTLESLAMGVAAALTAIHRAGVIHRDLKPGNVLLSAVGPKVIDFGIARAMDDDSAVTRSSQLMGTPSYLAPELIAGGPITAASDIFSWGCLVAYAGTGKAPFDAQTVPAVLQLISSGEADLQGLDPQLADLVRSALEKDPRNRPTAQQLLNMLVGQEDPAEAIVDSTVIESWTPPSTAAAAGAAAGAAGAGEGADGTAAGPPPGPDEIATEQSTRAVPPEAAASTPTRPYTGAAAAPHSPDASGSGPQAPFDRGPSSGPPPTANPGYAPPGHAGFPPPGGPPPPTHGSSPGPHPAYGPPPGPQPAYGPPSGPQPPYSAGPGPQRPPHDPAAAASPPYGQPGYRDPGRPDGPIGPDGRVHTPSAPHKRRRTVLLAGAGAGVLLLLVGGVLGSVLLLGGRPPEGTLVYQDDFAGGAWEHDPYEPDDEFQEYAYHADHGLVLRVSEYNDFGGSIGDYPPYEGEYPEAVLVRAEAEALYGPPYSEYGIRCYHQESDDEGVVTHYEGLVRFDGRSAQIRRAGGESGDAALATTGDVGGYTQPPDKLPMQKGGGSAETVTNTLTMTCEPDEDAGTMVLNLWVNGEHVLEAVDDEPLPDDATENQTRMAGVTVKRRGSAQDYPTVGFHRFEVQRLGEPGSTDGSAGGDR